MIILSSLPQKMEQKGSRNHDQIDNLAGLVVPTEMDLKIRPWFRMLSVNLGTDTGTIHPRWP